MSSSQLIVNFTQEWVESLRRWHLELFFIPTAAISLVAFLANPVLLTCIFLSRALREETRYLLVANTLTADLLFLTLNLATVVCNAVDARIPWVVCELITAFTVTSYCCAVLTVTLMVVDTYAAVRWPLHYRDLLPPARTLRILLGVWLLAATYPFTLFVVMETDGTDLGGDVPVCVVLISLGFLQITNQVGIHIYFLVAAVICAALIFFCYVRLYMVTRTQGIWQSRFSRARVTLLAHGLLLLLYFAPGLVFTLELLLFQKTEISQDVRVWISTFNMCVLTLLPRALAPYLYGLRYREISHKLTLLLRRDRADPQP